MSQPNVTRPRVSRHYRPPRPVGPKVEDLLAREWGCTPGTAHQRVLVLARQAGEVVAAMVRAGQHVRAIAWADPIMAALDLPLLAGKTEVELRHLAQEADALEEIAESRYRNNPTAEHRLVFARALADQEFVCRQLRLKLQEAL